MAEITAKNVITGEEISLGDVDLDQLTGRQAADGTPIVYVLLDKNGAILEPKDLRKLAELGYVDGDTVRIIQRGGGAR